MLVGVLASSIMAIRQKCQLDKLRVYVSLKDIQFKPEINVPFHEYFLAFYIILLLLFLVLFPVKENLLKDFFFFSGTKVIFMSFLWLKKKNDAFWCDILWFVSLYVFLSEHATTILKEISVGGNGFFVRLCSFSSSSSPKKKKNCAILKNPPLLICNRWIRCLSALIVIRNGWPRPRRKSGQVSADIRGYSLMN